MRTPLLLALALTLTACSNSTPVIPITSSSTGSSILVVDRVIPSRGTQIPITLTTPKNLAANVPLVVMLHGHGGSRHEAGGFTQVADALAEAGIASVRMDFPGCGDSRESFRNNTLTNMLADARAARDYAIKNTAIDTTRMALMGFSMGGRLAITLAAEDPRFQALALWAPSADAGTAGLADFMGGPEALATAKAMAAAHGFVPFTTTWGQKQELSAGWFADMDASTPLDLIANYKGAVFVLYGDKDTVVPPAEAERAVAAATRSRHAHSFVVAGADHGLGLFSDEPELTKMAVQQTVRVLIGELKAPYAP